jgi:hypothetical protein
MQWSNGSAFSSHLFAAKITQHELARSSPPSQKEWFNAPDFGNLEMKGKPF